MSTPIKYRLCTGEVEMQFLAVMIREQEARRDQSERDLQMANARFSLNDIRLINAGSRHLYEHLMWEALMEKMSRWIAELVDAIVVPATPPPLPAKKRKITNQK